MIQGILPGAHVHGVGIGEEGLAPQFLDDVHQHPGVAGPQMGHVAQLTEVDLDGHELILEVDPVNSGGHNEPGQLLGQSLAVCGAEIRKIYL